MQNERSRNESCGAQDNELKYIAWNHAQEDSWDVNIQRVPINAHQLSPVDFLRATASPEEKDQSRYPQRTYEDHRCGVGYEVILGLVIIMILKIDLHVSADGKCNDEGDHSPPWPVEVGIGVYAARETIPKRPQGEFETDFVFIIIYVEPLLIILRVKPNAALLDLFFTLLHNLFSHLLFNLTLDLGLHASSGLWVCDALLRKIGTRVIHADGGLIQLDAVSLLKVIEVAVRYVYHLWGSLAPGICVLCMPCIVV